MMTEAEKARFEQNLKELLLLLQGRRSASGTVLLLGSRASSFFRNPKFYEDIAHLFIGSSAFSQMSRPQQFSKSYEHLRGAVLNESDTHTYLKSWKDIALSKADLCLVELIKEGFFPTVVTTNIDHMIEDSFLRGNMKEGRDYHVLNFRTVIADKNNAANRIDRFTSYKTCKLVKVFGDMDSHDYAVFGHELHLDEDQQFKNYLLSALRGDVLAVGFDPLWDSAIEFAIPLVGGSFWYVDEEKPIQDSVIDRALRHRKGKFLSGEDGSYERFFETLHERLLPESRVDYLLRFDITSIARELDELQAQFQQLVEEFNALREKELKELQILRDDVTALRGEVSEISALKQDLATLIALLQKKS